MAIKPEAVEYTIDRLMALNAKAAGDPANLSPDEREEYMLLASVFAESLALASRQLADAWAEFVRAFIAAMGTLLDKLPYREVP